MAQDLISIIVPMYNVESYLEKTLNSILNQTYKNTEIILIDDASTDRTLEIASAYANKDSRIEIITQGINQGVSAARNAGLRKAKGSYITFVDPDDLMTKQAVENMYLLAIENDSDLVVGMYKNFSSKGTSLPGIYNRFPSLSSKGRIFTFTNPEVLFNFFCWGKLFKKDLIANLFFPKEITYTEDQPFMIYSYTHAKKIYIAPSIVYYYRKRDINTDSLSQKAIKDPITHLNYIFSSFELGRKYVDEVIDDERNVFLLYYLSRVVQGSIRYIFEGSILLNNFSKLKESIILLINWIEDLDDFLILGTSSFKTIFVDLGQEYIKYFNTENQRLYIQLVKLIRDKMQVASLNNHQRLLERNNILDAFTSSIDNFVQYNLNLSFDLFFVCYPRVRLLNQFMNYAKVSFQIAIKKENHLYQAIMKKSSNKWVIDEVVYLNQVQKQTKVIKSRKPKILLTYREFSGSNSLAMFKKIPSFISDHYQVEMASGNKMTNSYVQKVSESDIVVTTNMEYAFSKYSFDPNKLVIDLWHGFPLKKMFFEDPFFSDKNTIEQYWRQIDYLASYSDLYSNIVNKCLRVTPEKYVVTGAPRNDLLFNPNSRERLFKILNKEDEGQKFIIYMPTFRQSDQTSKGDESYKIFDFIDFDSSSLIRFLEDNNYELIVKSHPIFKRNLELYSEMSSNITIFPSEKLLDEFIDFYEVLGAAEVLITDYSSVYFDFLLLDKPIIFTPVDLEEYKDERGFLLNPYEEWTPGPKVLTQQTLQNEIMNYEKNKEYYKCERKRIKDKVHHYQDSLSSERVWQLIISLSQ
ncbi:CDP-glycerol glycerophosphotransferase family protein [Psychrobacillus sp. OK032]|uniref:bifunctional glycosyltransferase/CDP-glycerol:glycerophosphate glycerophosphotransferase n=1 Tax=Psychrobacillus sp. OK032 TaxID=1884358 RepID=UPI0008BB831E|nr:CDP-glycerol glycerophosphotransferase family protein [Psychrobacillus sp. OK032]SER65322.1 CDP-glycerol glycerophosphotransferase, TagB/SpsB family [Psychrobacillus sp. OK032]